MKQQSKLDWLNDGDSDIRFFFVNLRQINHSNYVYSLKNEKGDKVEGLQKVAQVMIDYYKKLLGKQKTNRVTMDQEVTQQGPKLSIEQQIRLNASFTDLEIKKAIFFIPNPKSPGSDGLVVGFSNNAGIKLDPKS